MKKVVVYTSSGSSIETWRPWLEQHFEIAFITSPESLLTLIKTWSPDVLIYAENKIQKELLSKISTYAHQLHLLLGIVVVAQQYNLREELLSFQLNADHFILASTPPQSVLARLQSLIVKNDQLKNHNTHEDPIILPKKVDQLKYKELVLLPDQNIVLRRDLPIRITPTQTRLFLALLTHPDQVLTREWIQSHVFNGAHISLRSIDAHIAKLKRALPCLNTEIINIYGQGYILKSYNNKAS